MKSIALNAVLAASAAQAYILPARTNKIDWRLEQKRQIVGSMTSLLGKGGKVADPAGAAPKRVNLQSTSKLAGVKRVKMRYGPYMVINTNKTSLVGESGMLWNYPDLAIPKPCTECTIVGQVAGLEYKDGKNANIDTGLWLHHMVQLTIGRTRWDPTCFGRSSLPHVDVNSTPGGSERYFSSGNERTKVDLDIHGSNTKYGYHLRPEDKFGFIVDLMNMNPTDATVYLTMTYDFLDGPLPAGWKDIKVIWFDANQCGTSEVQPPKQNGRFTISSNAWAPNFDGEIIGVGGHVHDGGVEISIQYDGKPFCVSKAGYAEKPEFVFGGKMDMAKEGAGHTHKVASKHISSMTSCYLSANGATVAGIGSREGLPIKSLKQGSSWKVVASYDYDKFEGNKNGKGTQDEIMAISLMYVAVDPNLQRPGGAGAAVAKSGKGRGKGRYVETNGRNVFIEDDQPIIKVLN